MSRQNPVSDHTAASMPCGIKSAFQSLHGTRAQPRRDGGTFLLDILCTRPKEDMYVQLSKIDGSVPVNFLVTSRHNSNGPEMNIGSYRVLSAGCTFKLASSPLAEPRSPETREARTAAPVQKAQQCSQEARKAKPGHHPDEGHDYDLKRAKAQPEFDILMPTKFSLVLVFLVVLVLLAVVVCVVVVVALEGVGRHAVHAHHLLVRVLQYGSRDERVLKQTMCKPLLAAEEGRCALIMHRGSRRHIFRVEASSRNS